MRRQWLLTVLVATALLGGAPVSLGAQDQLFRINNMVEPESLDPGNVEGAPGDSGGAGERGMEGLPRYP